MQNMIARLHKNIKRLKDEIYLLPASELSFKKNPKKWSRKEIFGHLIDSARFNLMRFNAIPLHQGEDYKVIPYPQDDLVKQNDYQGTDLVDLVVLWQALNRQVSTTIGRIAPEDLEKKISVNGETKTLYWLIEDYVVHIEYHLNQILAPAEGEGTVPACHLTEAQAQAALAKVPTEFVNLLTFGEVEVEYYQPNEVDKQQPHTRDELYIVSSGKAWFIRENEKYEVKENDVLFVKAGEEHRFVDFSKDFATWVVFYGLPLG